MFPIQDTLRDTPLNVTITLHYSYTALTVASVHGINDFGISEAEVVPFLAHESLQVGISGDHGVPFEHATAESLKEKKKL